MGYDNEVMIPGVRGVQEYTKRKLLTIKGGLECSIGIYCNAHQKYIVIVPNSELKPPS